MPRTVRTPEGGKRNNYECPLYMGWDEEHPTTAGDTLIADAAVAALPEPSSLAMPAARDFCFSFPAAEHWRNRQTKFAFVTRRD